MIFYRCPARELVFDLVNPRVIPAGRLADEGAGPAQAIDQVVGDMPELGGEILMNVENVHVFERTFSAVAGRKSIEPIRRRRDQ